MCISLKTNPRELREALRRITNLAPEQIPQHPAHVAALRTTYPHSILAVMDREVNHLPLERFTCFMHALRLVTAPKASRLMEELQIQPRSDFLAYLVASHLSELAAKDARDGDFVLYSNGKEITHAGTVKGTRIVSKWGLGQLWEHEVLEVPAQYGDEVRFYRGVEQVEAEQLFVAYVRTQEGTELVDTVLAD